MCGYAAAYGHSFCVLYRAERHVDMQPNNSFQKVRTAYTTAPHNQSQHNQASSHEVLTSLVLVSPDDGHNDSRNMLRLI
jgi:hypothetical protein